MQVIAARTDDTWGLTEEEEFITSNEQLKEIFLEFGWVKPYDNTKPLPPKGLNDYESGLGYPKDRYIILEGNLFKSNCVTSSTWVLAEWDVKITGFSA